MIGAKGVPRVAVLARIGVVLFVDLVQNNLCKILVNFKR